MRSTLWPTDRVFVRSHIIVIFEIFLTTSIDNFLLIWDFFINCTRLVKISLIFEILELFEGWQKIREEGSWSFSAPLPRGRIRIAAHGFLSSRHPWAGVPWGRHRPRSPGCSWTSLQINEAQNSEGRTEYWQGTRRSLGNRLNRARIFKPF